MIKAIIFDFFGVIVLSTRQMIDEKYDLDAQQSRDLTDVNKAFDKGYVDDSEFLHSFADIIGISFESFIRDFYEPKERFNVYEETLTFIREQKETYKVGLLTNVSDKNYQKFIKPVAKEFDAIVKSYEVNLTKPQVEIYELMTNELGVDVADCVMIDDSEINCEGARAAGMNTIRHTSLAETKVLLAKLLDS